MALAPTESTKQTDVQSRMMEWTELRGSRKRASSKSELCLFSSWPFLCSSKVRLWDRTSWVTPCSFDWNPSKRWILYNKHFIKPQVVPSFSISLLLKVDFSVHGLNRIKCSSLFTRFLTKFSYCLRGHLRPKKHCQLNQPERYRACWVFALSTTLTVYMSNQTEKTDLPWHKPSVEYCDCHLPSPSVSLGLCGQPVCAQGLLPSVNTSPVSSVLCKYISIIFVFPGFHYNIVFNVNMWLSVWCLNML